MRPHDVSAVEILGVLSSRLSRLMACKRFGSVPRALREDRPDCIRIGKATKEQQALAILYNQIAIEHEQLHKRSGLPFGVNPNVSTVHYRYHVMMDLIPQMLDWSVMRAFPKQKSALKVLFDKDWVMYGEKPTITDTQPPKESPEE